MVPRDATSVQRANLVYVLVEISTICELTRPLRLADGSECAFSLRV